MQQKFFLLPCPSALFYPCKLRFPRPCVRTVESGSATGFFSRRRDPQNGASFAPLSGIWNSRTRSSVFIKLGQAARQSARTAFVVLAGETHNSAVSLLLFVVWNSADTSRRSVFKTTTFCSHR
uniref:Uncharacterized protein n=1 Tax=Branchiostoma floridae TaxID=7739 RepID=C3ZPV5_BRAFL|eukprot:XP_002589323.1 hypothetical protein BRAFLDRAFT_77776 [Branchiostoma floridae]